jgi:hypothetical protein
MPHLLMHWNANVSPVVRNQTEPDYAQVVKSPGLIRVPGNQAIVLFNDSLAMFWLKQ